MARDKAKDEKYFNCLQESELKYLSELYTMNNEVKDFLIFVCERRIITNSTYKEVYEYIKRELGYEIPN